jgi:hypothetical protein
MQFDPCGPGNIKLEFAMRNRSMIALANVSESKHTRQSVAGRQRRSLSVRREWGRYCKSHGIPIALGWRPSATSRVSEIAECLENVLGRSLLFMAGSRAVAAPTASQWQSSGMRPVAVFYPFDWHEVRAGQFVLLGEKFGNRHCNRRQIAGLLSTGNKSSSLVVISMAETVRLWTVLLR